ncbi:hypothetical protein AVEN_31637-1 [Araneus ventricosus]|uniref:Uncharacterized protein n=1 Tax=Araneus ventricosus TaxID=182803 RepID=A0A4Y2JP15_ARAVE|nr:hypothetical protein AVEN_31637-1 [Araneus ventricosus]
MTKRAFVGVMRKLGEGVPTQVSSSSSDRGSKLRGPSQNSPRVASKRDVNITKTEKLNLESEGFRLEIEMEPSAQILLSYTNYKVRPKIALVSLLGGVNITKIKKLNSESEGCRLEIDLKQSFKKRQTISTEGPPHMWA